MRDGQGGGEAAPRTVRDQVRVIQVASRQQAQAAAVIRVSSVRQRHSSPAMLWWNFTA